MRKAAIAVLVVVLIVLAFRGCGGPFGGAYVVQSRRPLGPAEARDVSGLPSPDSARNVRYAHFREWIGYETFLRFEAPVTDCLVFARRAIAESDAYHKRQAAPVEFSALRGPVDPSEGRCADLETGWFDVQAIRRGVEGASGPSHAPKIWIDTEHGVCYLKEHD